MESGNLDSGFLSLNNIGYEWTATMLQYFVVPGGFCEKRDCETAATWLITMPDSRLFHFCPKHTIEKMKQKPRVIAR